MVNITIKDMMEAGVHFGHQTKRWNPKMAKYIFGSRNGINIIDLQKTVRLLDRALDFVKSVSADGGSILFVGAKPQAKDIIRKNAERCGMPFVNERWLGGMLTNFETIKSSVARLKELDGMEEDGTFEILAKKEVIKLQKERGKLEKCLGGIKNMDKLPDAMYIVDTKKEHIALKEGLKLGIPIIAIVDTNCDPDGIEYIIPGNDDAVRSINLITSAIADAALAGAEEHSMKQKALAEEKEREEAARKAAKKQAEEQEAEVAAEQPPEEKAEPASAADPADEVPAEPGE